MSADRRTYIRVHDGMPEHPKVIGLSNAAFRAYVELLCWSSRHLTDGAVPAAAALRVARPKTLCELTAAGLLESDSDTYALHDYLLHQRSRQEVADAVDQRRAAGQRGGQAKASRLAGAKRVATESLPISLSEPPSEMPTETASKALPESETETEKYNPPTPSELPPPAAKRPRSKPRTAIPAVWPTDPTHATALTAWSTDHTPSLDLRHETAQWLDYHRAKGDTAADWTASWRTWMRRAQADTERRPSGRLAIAGPRPSTTDQRVGASLARAAELRAQERA